MKFRIICESSHLKVPLDGVAICQGTYKIFALNWLFKDDKNLCSHYGFNQMKHRLQRQA